MLVPSQDGSVLVALENVSKSWGNYRALDRVDLELRAGSVTCIAGGNGAGKTTLLRIVTGMILPDAGTARFLGADIETAGSEYRRALGFLSAGDRGLYARLTVSQNLDFWAGLAGLPRRHRRRRLERLLPEFELGDLAERRVDRLSMGQRQRVRLAMTFLHEPLVVFLDEPKTSLDELGTSSLNRALGELVEDGGAALVVAPEADLDLADRSWRLRDGRLSPILAAAGQADPAEDHIRQTVLR